MPSFPAGSEQRVAAMRRFNRFYTRQIGLLDEGLLNSPFSLTQVRTLYELAQRDQTTAVELCTTLGLDAGYLSRILASFRKTGLIERQESPDDARQTLLRLTKKGRKAFEPLNARSNEQVSRMLSALPPTKPDACNPTSCARSARVIWVGWCGGTAFCTRKNTAMTSVSRLW